VSQVDGRVLHADLIEEVVRRYLAKESQAAIATALGLRRGVVRRILVDRGVSLRGRSPTSEGHRQAVLNRHAEGKRIKEISSELGLDFTTVYRILRRAGRVKKLRQ
jgi:DNA invertase Pin-like site-specific DNA recombinase